MNRSSFSHLFPTFLHLAASAASWLTPPLMAGLVFFTSAHITLDISPASVARFLEKRGDNFAAEAGKAFLDWSPEAGRLVLHVDTARLIDATTKEDLAVIPIFEAVADFRARALGAESFTSLTLKNLHIRLQQGQDGSLSFGVPKTVVQSLNMPRGSQALKAMSPSVFRSFNTVTIDNARVSVTSLATLPNSHNWQFGIASLTLLQVKDGSEGNAVFTVQSKGKENRITATYRRDRDNAQQDRRQWTATLRDFPLPFLALTDDDLAGFANYTMPLSGVISATLTDSNQIATIDSDLKLGASTIKTTGTVAPDGDDRTVVLDITTAGIPFQGLDKIWPEGIAPNPRAWVTANILAGSVKSAAAHLEAIAPNGNPAALNVIKLDGTMAVTGGTIRYFEGLEPIRGIDAKASFDLRGMTVTTTGGKIYDIALQPATLTFTGFADPIQNLDISGAASGRVEQILRVLDAPRLGYAKALGLKPDDIQGQITASLHFAFPLLANLALKDVTLSVQGTTKNVASSTLVEGIPISGGALTMDLTKDALKLAGTAQIFGLSSRLTWQENFGADANPQSRGKIHSSFDGTQLDGLGDIFKGVAVGPVAMDMTYLRKSDKSATVTASADLTKAAVRLYSLNWQKSRGPSTTLDLTADIPPHGPVQIKKLSLQGPDLDIRGSGTLNRETLAPQDLTLSPVRAGKTDIIVTARQDSDGVISTDIKGSLLDLSSLSDKPVTTPDTPKPQTPWRAKLNIARTIFGEDRMIGGLTGTVEHGRVSWVRMDVTATAHGKNDKSTPFAMHLRPDGPSPHFRAETSDAGTVFYAMNVADSVEGGVLILTGDHDDAKDPRILNGQILMKDFQVSGMPVLAKLLGAASFEGFADLVSGAPVGFDRLEANFRWRGADLVINKMRTAGGALGMTMQGKANIDTEIADLQGTLVPFSFVNRLVGGIPFLGDLLTGGDGGGIFAFTYRIKGPLADPDVSVNPLAALAPGIFRNIFFIDTSETQLPDEQPAKAKP
jgi:hypothetical protein